MSIWGDSLAQQIGGINEADVLNHFELMFSGSKQDTLRGKVIASYAEGINEINYWKSYWIERGAGGAVAYFFVPALTILGKYYSAGSEDINTGLNDAWEDTRNFEGITGGGGLTETIDKIVHDVKVFSAGAGVSGIVIVGGLIALLIFAAYKAPGKAARIVSDIKA